MSQPDSELVKSLKRILHEQPEVLDAYLFGSAARGSPGPLSDVDVAVWIENDRSPDPAFGYGAALATDLMAGLGRNRVDVVILNQAPALLYHRVLRDGVRLVSRDPSATTTREGRALSRYCDYLPQLRKIDVAHELRVKSGSFGE